MSFLEDIGDEPNGRDKETILRKVVFVKIRDHECNVEGWRYEVEYFGLTTSSLRTYENLVDCIRDYLEFLEKNDPPID